MKNIIYALLGLLGVLVSVVTISFLLSHSLREIERKIEAYSFDSAPDYMLVANEFIMLREEFNEKAPTLSLLVADDALMEIEQYFSDVIGYAKAESYDGVITSVGKLQIGLEHLRELAGLTIKSVF